MEKLKNNFGRCKTRIFPSACSAANRPADAERDQEGWRHGQDEVRGWRRSASHAVQVAGERGTPPGETLMEIYGRRAAPAYLRPRSPSLKLHLHIRRDFYLFIKMLQSVPFLPSHQRTHADKLCNPAREVDKLKINSPPERILSAARCALIHFLRDGPRWRFFFRPEEKATFSLCVSTRRCLLSIWILVESFCMRRRTLSAPRLICLLN